MGVPAEDHEMEKQDDVRVDKFNPLDEPTFKMKGGDFHHHSQYESIYFSGS